MMQTSRQAIGRLAGLDLWARDRDGVRFALRSRVDRCANASVDEGAATKWLKDRTFGLGIEVAYHSLYRSHRTTAFDASAIGSHQQLQDI